MLCLRAAALTVVAGVDAAVNQRTELCFDHPYDWGGHIICSGDEDMGEERFGGE